MQANQTSSVVHSAAQMPSQDAASVPGYYEQKVTPKELKEALPKNLKGYATEELADKLNTIVADPRVAESIRENFISYASVLQDGKFRIGDYVNAIVYCSYKLMDYTNQEAYKKTFPKRYRDLRAKGADDKTISAYVAGYNKGKLVNAIMEQTLIPTWVLNQSIYQEAINHQAYLMRNAQSEKVQTEAANSLLTHLKKPETKQVDLNIGFDESDGMAELKDTLAQLAQSQKALIESGATTRAIAHQKLGEAIDITPVDVTSEAENND